MATSQVQEAQVPPSVNESQSNEPNRLEDPYSKFMPLTAEQRHFNHDTQVKHENKVKHEMETITQHYSMISPSSIVFPHSFSSVPLSVVTSDAFGHIDNTLDPLSLYLSLPA
jgi:hypothetical protein